MKAPCHLATLTCVSAGPPIVRQQFRRGAPRPVLFFDQHPREPARRETRRDRGTNPRRVRNGQHLGLYRAVARGVGYGHRRGWGASERRPASTACDCPRAAARAGLLSFSTRRPARWTRSASGWCRKRFSRILPGKTAIFIAHRLSTVKDCDRIIVLDEGRIVQDGTFEQLRHEPGLFQQHGRERRFLKSAGRNWPGS